MILFGTEGVHAYSNYSGLRSFIVVLDTDNLINERDGGYEHVTTLIPIGQPNAGTLAKLSELEPSMEIGDRTCSAIALPEIPPWTSSPCQWLQSQLTLGESVFSWKVAPYTAFIPKQPEVFWTSLLAYSLLWIQPVTDDLLGLCEPHLTWHT